MTRVSQWEGFKALHHALHWRLTVPLTPRAFASNEKQVVLSRRARRQAASTQASLSWRYETPTIDRRYGDCEDLETFLAERIYEFNSETTGYFDGETAVQRCERRRMLL